jgi:hypothetical protein
LQVKFLPHKVTFPSTIARAAHPPSLKFFLCGGRQQNFRALYPKNRRKAGAKPRQDRRKILCGARRRKEYKFCPEKSCGKISPPKARPKPTKKEVKDQKTAAAKSSR